MKRFRFTAIIIILSMVLTLIGAGTTLKEAVSVDGTVSLVTGDLHIIRPAESNNGVELSSKLYKALKNRSSASVTLADDTSEEFQKEIIIGESDRAETAYAYSLLAQQGGGLDSDYIICELNGDVVIAGNSEESTGEAVERFLGTYLSQGEIKSGTVDVNVSSENATSITINGTKLSSLNSYIITPKYNMSYIVSIQVDNLKAAIKTAAGVTVSESTDFTVKNNINTANSAGNYGYNGYMNCATEAEWLQYKEKYYSLDKTKTRTNPKGWAALLGGKTYEIVIGNCDRDGVPVITNKEEYTIKVSDTRVYLNGGSPYATAMAVSEFAKMVLEGNLALTDNSTFTANYYDNLPSYDRSAYYTVTWADDFEGDKINEALWHISYDDENIYSVGLNGRYNYRASKELKNNYVKDGKFYIDAVYTDEAYYGGMLITNDTMLYKYGYVESSSLLPSGQGFWTALWLSSNSGEKGYAYTEIDVNECYGPGHYVLCNTFSHFTTAGKKYITDINSTSTRTAFHIRNDHCANDNRGYYLDFHTFGYELDENTLRFTVDGETYYEQKYATQNIVVSSTNEFADAEKLFAIDAYHSPNYLRLSMALGFESRAYVVPDNDDAWDKYNKYITDYVHIYQKTGLTGASKQTIQMFKSYNKDGDVNGDGNIDLVDAAMLERYLASWNRYDFLNMDVAAADMSGDGYITTEDLLILKKLLAGHDGFWGGDSTKPDVGEDDGEEGEWTPWQ